MARILSDVRINQLLAERKTITRRDIDKLKRKLKRNTRGRMTASVRLLGNGKRRFQVTSDRNPDPNRPFNFSIILSFVWHGRSINLIRCNGHHAEHDNKIEQKAGHGVQGVPANTFHIHRATERYQRNDQLAESYAEPTAAYDSFEGAIETMIDKFGFFISDDEYRTLHPLFAALP